MCHTTTAVLLPHRKFPGRHRTHPNGFCFGAEQKEGFGRGVIPAGRFGGPHQIHKAATDRREHKFIAQKGSIGDSKFNQFQNLLEMYVKPKWEMLPGRRNKPSNLRTAMATYLFRM